MTAPHPHPRKGNRAVEHRMHIAVRDVLERCCLPEWRFAYMGVKDWPDFAIVGPLRCCFLKLRTSNGSVSQAHAELAAFLITRGYGYGLACTVDDAVSILRDWGCVPPDAEPVRL